MTVSLTIAGLAPEFGGPSRSVPALAEALGRAGVAVEVIACESERGFGAPVLPDSTLVDTQLVSARSRRGRWRASQNDFFRVLCERESGAGEVIHDNGLWLPTNHAVAKAAHFLKRPLIISARGMLSDWATAYHGWKKRMAWWLFQRRDLLGAAALHATSPDEAADFRRVGFRGPIAVVPNGVELPDLPAPCSPHSELRRDGGVRDKRGPVASGEPAPSSAFRTALFMSRIHPKKGLLDLVNAWAAVRPQNWRMIVAGNDEGGHRREVEAAIDRHALTGIFTFAGAVGDAAKWDVYRDADLFVLPSHSENFGIVVAEALASGLPVITTRGTPWKELIEHRCGWWEEIGAEPLAAALKYATSLSDEERREMGRRGRELIASKYSWSRVAGEMKSLYEWLCGHAERPSFVLV